jgi:hypothetical protein
MTRFDGMIDGCDCTPIDHPLTRDAIQLFNAAYRVTLRLLMRFYAPGTESMSERLALGKLALYPLMTLILRPLGELLTQMPAGSRRPGRTAGPTFESAGETSLSPHPRSAWFTLHDQLLDLVDRCASLRDALKTHSEPWMDGVRSRMEFMQQNLGSIAVRLEFAVHLRAESAKLSFHKILDHP